MCIKDAAAGLLRSVKIGQRHRNLVIDPLLALLRCQKLVRRQTCDGRQIDTDQVMDELSGKASPRRLYALAARLGLLQQALPNKKPRQDRRHCRRY